MKNIILYNILFITFFKVTTVIGCSNSGTTSLQSTGNYQQQVSSSLPSTNYFNAPIITNNLSQQSSNSNLQSDTLKSFSKPITLSSQPPKSIRYYGSKNMETNTSENLLGSIKNMWDESWQKIDDFFGGRNVMSSNKNLKPFSKRLYLTNVTYDLVIQPPTAWSYCEPYCGVDDQGVDMESANDTLNADVTESISDVFRTVLHVEPPSKNNLKIIFEPQNILGMGFGDFYDRKGQRYIMSRGTVTNVLTRGQVIQKKFTQPLTITFLTRHKMKEIKWENLGYVITERIKKFQKGFMLSERIKVIVEDI